MRGGMWASRTSSGHDGAFRPFRLPLAGGRCSGIPAALTDSERTEQPFQFPVMHLRTSDYLRYPRFLSPHPYIAPRLVLARDSIVGSSCFSHCVRARLSAGVRISSEHPITTAWARTASPSPPSLRLKRNRGLLPEVIASRLCHTCRSTVVRSSLPCCQSNWTAPHTPSHIHPPGASHTVQWYPANQRPQQCPTTSSAIPHQRAVWQRNQPIGPGHRNQQYYIQPQWAGMAIPRGRR